MAIVDMNIFAWRSRALLCIYQGLPQAVRWIQIWSQHVRMKKMFICLLLFIIIFAWKACDGGRGVCIAQSKHSCFPPRTQKHQVQIPACFPPSSPRFESQLRRDFLSLLLSLRTVLRSNPSGAKQCISQMQLAVTSRTKYYKKGL